MILSYHIPLCCSETNPIHLIPKTQRLDLHLSISNDLNSSKIYTRRDDFKFDSVTIIFDGDGVYYSVYSSSTTRLAVFQKFFLNTNTWFLN